MASRPHSGAQPAIRRLLKLTTVAEALDCSVDSLDRYIRAGKLPVVRLPSGRRRIAEEDLSKIIEDWKETDR